MTTSLNQPNRIKPQIPFLTVCRLCLVKVCQEGLKFVRRLQKMGGWRLVPNTQNTPGQVAISKPKKAGRVGSFSAFLGWFDPVRTRTQGAKTCFSLFNSCFGLVCVPELGLSNLSGAKFRLSGFCFPYSGAQIWN